MRLFFGCSFLVFVVSVAQAQIVNDSGADRDKGVRELGSGRWLSPFDSFLLDDRYRIGDEWGKQVVTKDKLAEGDAVYRRAAYATARVGGGTGFYLGLFNNEHLIATNHHVCPSVWDCVGLQARFTALKKSFTVVKMLGSWTAVDLAILVIAIPSGDDAELLRAYAGNFDFKGSIVPGQPLLTAGYGVADNPQRGLVVNQDSDCKVFSDTDEFMFMPDPDEFNPGPYKAWSFANGCDVSHGDSGSAMVDRSTGKVIGLIWTGRIPKSAKVQSSTYLNQLLIDKGAEIWSELSYGVPAAKIHAFVSDLLLQKDLGVDVEATLAEWIHLPAEKQPDGDADAKP
jgi:hypothetical protein